MKYLFHILLIIPLIVLGQVPQGINYQAVAYDANGFEISNQDISVRLGILLGGVDAEASYTEVHSVTTDDFGLFSLIISQGETSDTFSSINWEQGAYLKVEVDEDLDGEYSVMGVSSFNAVPYALSAPTSDDILSRLNQIDSILNSLLLADFSTNLELNSIDYTNNGIVYLNSIFSSTTNDFIGLKGYCWSNSNNTPTIYDSYMILDDNDYQLSFYPDTDSSWYFIRSFVIHELEGIKYSNIDSFYVDLYLGMEYEGGHIYSLNGDGSGSVFNHSWNDLGVSDYNFNYQSYVNNYISDLDFNGFQDWSILNCDDASTIYSLPMFGGYGTIWVTPYVYNFSNDICSGYTGSYSSTSFMIKRYF